MTSRQTRNFAWMLIAIFFLSMGIGAAFAQNNFTIPNDVPGRNPTFVRSAPTYVNARVLAANVAETITLPAGTKIAIFSANCNFYANWQAAATVPAADVTDGTASELNPSAYYFPNADSATQTVSVISDVACIVTAAAYKGRLQ